MRFLALCLFGSLSASVAAAQSPFVRVDAFGYEPFARKVAVLRDPVVGFDAAASFTPGATIEVVRESDGAVVMSGAPTVWGGGQVHATSGDRAWWFDFTAVQNPGTYRIVDAASGESSEPFDITADPFAAARRAAVRTFYYQRCAQSKVPPFADPRWADGASHVGSQQDLDCRSVSNPGGPGLDLSGGWYDAGDYNKYVNFTDDVLQDLLSAYQVNPDLWGDASGIPESGNGVPDLLDEVRWGLEWMLRMQRPSGGVLHKVSVTDFSAASPPSADTAPRRYAEVTASATASAAAAYARGAHVFGGQPDASSQAFAAQLEAAAVAAWGWLQANPAFSSYGNQGFLNVDAEDSATFQGMVRVNAAVWLAHVTGDPAYHAYVAANWNAVPGYELGGGGWSSPYQVVFTEALLRYAELSGASAAVRNEVQGRFLASLGGYWLNRVVNEDDPYRAFLGAGDHVWGSNRTVAATGSMHAEAARLDPCNAAWHAQAARDYAHHFHGVNAAGFTYLTNMGELGADNSVQEMYHAWFGDGTIWDRAENGNPGPVPGFVTGGPNVTFEPDPAYTGPPIVPPMNQPPAKSYLDWNPGWPEASWSVTENSTGYQSQYILLLAHVAPGAQNPAPFCPGSVNSTGERAHLSVSGSTSLVQNAMTLELRCAPASTFGLFFYGPMTQASPAGNGTVCVGGARRIAPVVTINGAGSASLTLDLASFPFVMSPSAVSAGETWSFQAWHRDSIGALFGTSDASLVTFLP